MNNLNLNLKQSVVAKRVVLVVWVGNADHAGLRYREDRAKPASFHPPTARPDGQWAPLGSPVTAPTPYLTLPYLTLPTLTFTYLTYATLLTLCVHLSLNEASSASPGLDPSARCHSSTKINNPIISL